MRQLFSRGKKPAASSGGRGYFILAGIFGSIAVIALAVLAVHAVQASREQAAFDALARSALPTEAESSELTADQSRLALARCKLLHERNPDLAGWLTIEGTAVDYPVMCTPAEPEYYLHRAFDGSRAMSGTPFTAEGCTLESDCVIIYGHNMNNETMFGTLDRYQDAAFWAANPTFTLTTPEEERTYEVFAAAVCRVLNTEEAGFRYYDHAGELTEAQQEALTAWLAGQALYETGISPAFGEQIVILSTCSYHTDNGRFIVAARRIV